MPLGIAIGDIADFQGLHPKFLETETIRKASATEGFYVTAATDTINHAEIEEE
ncbi:MAG TPA: hypothetical protein VEQ18_01835 [Candidatus Nitrosocosmicus sp.]|nr:hypothetical protein [Candidatus Nitrosocosmicus sp.]